MNSLCLNPQTGIAFQLKTSQGNETQGKITTKTRAHCNANKKTNPTITRTLEIFQKKKKKKEKLKFSSQQYLNKIIFHLCKVHEGDLILFGIRNMYY